MSATPSDEAHGTVLEMSDIQSPVSSAGAGGGVGVDGAAARSPGKAKNSAPDAESQQEDLFKATRLEVLHPCQPATLVFKNLNLSVPVVNQVPDPNAAPKRKCCGGKPPMTEKQILFDICGSVSPGELVAVIGASGAGKTTLLDVLSGRKQSFTGSYTLNGEPISEARALTAYVQQQDLFLPNLTPREHLMYLAHLKLSASEETKRELVDELISKLGLSECQSTVIGHLSSNFGVRGLSGGERKRLAFAAEVLSDPSVLFVDEPTSGLDAFMAESVVRQLRTLAKSGRSVVVTIHQPSSEVYSLFSKVLLLSRGRVAYFGPVNRAIAYFNSIGHACPAFNNPADYFVKVLANLTEDVEGTERVRRITKAWKAYVERTNASLLTNDVVESDVKTGLWRFFGQYRANTASNPGADGPSETKEAPGAPEAPESGEQKRTSTPMASPIADLSLEPEEDEDEGRVPGASETIRNINSSSVPPKQVVDGYANSWFKELYYLVKRGAINTARDPVLTKARLGQTLVLALIVGLVYLRLDDNQQGVQDKNGAVFFVIVNQAMSGVFGVLQTFPMERPVFFREHESGNYRVSTFYISKIIGDLPFQIVFPVIFMCIMWWMTGIRDDFNTFLGATGFVLLGANAAMSLGYLISAGAPSVGAALALGPIMILPFMLFGGFFLNSDSVPAYFIWIEAISFFKYSFHGVQTLIWRDVGLLDCDKPDRSDCPFESGRDVLDFYEIEEDLALSAGMLVVLIVALRLLGLLSLQYRAQQYKKNA